MLKLVEQADLQRLIDEEIQESLTLDTKLRRPWRKTVHPAMNSARTYPPSLILRVGKSFMESRKKKGKPTKIDQGSQIAREWIEQVINSNVQPRIEGLVITPIPVGGGRHAYVLTIPQALARAPHQARDHKYYKRQNFQSIPMEDYEIRDALRRGTTPELYVELAFAMGQWASIEFAPESEISHPIVISVTVKNRSAQPAYHAMLQVGVDTELPLQRASDFFEMGITGDERQQYWLARRFLSPPGLPIFKEIDQDVVHRLSFTIAFRGDLMRRDRSFGLTTSIQTPGYSATENWKIRLRGGMLQMCPPGHST